MIYWFAGACVSVTLLWQRRRAGQMERPVGSARGPTESEWAAGGGRGTTSLNCYIGPSLSL